MKLQLFFISILITLGPHTGLRAENPGKITFLENKGQVSDQNNKPRPDVLFSGNTTGMTFHLRNNGLSYQFTRIESWKEEQDPMRGEKRKTPDLTTIYRLDLDWLNCATNPLMQTDEALPGFDNYYLATCPDGVRNVKSYAGVTYKNIYNHVDLHFYEKNGILKYDYLVAAGADYRQIQLSVKGAEKISLNNSGELIISTPFGTISEAAPLVIQDGKVLPSKWVIKNTVLSFEIRNIQSGRAFVIDPLIRTWGTYYGHVYSDGLATTTDAMNNVYMTGSTGSTSLIATLGSYQSTCPGGNVGYLVKFNSAGVRAWGTYYGATRKTMPKALATDAMGNVFMAGFTTDSVAITTPGSHKQVYDAANYGNAFLVKFDASGSRLWGTYYGGSSPAPAYPIIGETAFGCATDAGGNVYITGSTLSHMGISTPGCYQSALNGPVGAMDAFLVKFNSAGVRQWGTYYGGTSDDGASSCAIDASGNIYICGGTESNNGIATPGTQNPTFLGGDRDGFLTKFNSQGVLLWGTYYGNDAQYGSDAAECCAIDQTGNVFITGLVSSGTSTVNPNPINTYAMIATPGCHQALPSGAQYDVYLAKFNSTGLRQWGTYYGSGGHGRSCATDLSGNVYITGNASFPPFTGFASSGAFQSVPGGNDESFMAKFNTTGQRQYGTLYGGSGFEIAYGCAVDALSRFYMTGLTSTTLGIVIATPGSQQPYYGTSSSNAGNAFLVQFADCEPIVNSVAQSDPLCNGGANGSATITASSGTLSLNYSWQPAGGNSASPTGLSAGNYTYTISNNCYNVTNTIAINEPPAIALLTSSSNSLTCPGNNCTLSVNGSGGTGLITYTWSAGGTGSSITVSPSATTIYSVSGTDANGCSKTTTITQKVNACLSVSSLVENVHFSVYPNPASSQLTIESSQPGSVKLFDALSRLILTQQLSNEKTKLDLEGLHHGVYFLQINQNGFEKTIRLIKE